ncbi:MAG TPA: hypothetical protein DCM21_01155 [Butyrivibrio sp.]|nr:hypothetical protein [Butyrivibrio sp.]
MSIQEFIIRIFIIIVVGIVIGIERQITGHNIGVKTTILIALGTFAFVSVEVLFKSDDLRMAANIITGIGFLCSGVIFKNGLTVNGINTSATLWSTSAISVLISYGFIIQGVIATVVLISFNLILAYVSGLIKPISKLADIDDKTYYIETVCLKNNISNVKKVIFKNLSDKISLVELQVNSITSDKYRIKAKINSSDKYIDEIDKITNKILNTDVFSAKWEKLEG